MQVVFGFRRGSERASSHAALVSDVARQSTHPRCLLPILHHTQSMELFIKGIVINHRQAVHEFERKRGETWDVMCSQDELEIRSRDPQHKSSQGRCVLSASIAHDAIATRPHLTLALRPCLVLILIFIPLLVRHPQVPVRLQTC